MKKKKMMNTQIIREYNNIYGLVEGQRGFNVLVEKVKNIGVSGPVRARARGIKKNVRITSPKVDNKR